MNRNELIQKVKYRTNQISKNKVLIKNEFIPIDNLSKNIYRKCQISCIFIDIVGYTNLCEDVDEKEIGKIIRIFHEGILDLLRFYGLKHIQIQGDGIFGIIHTPKNNDKNSKKIFECAMEINGFLGSFWNEIDYRISISENEELMVVVGNNKNNNENTRQIVFAGGAINKAKKQMDGNKYNCILIDDIFKEKNKNILFNKETVESFISGKTHLGTYYSEYIFEDWE